MYKVMKSYTNVNMADEVECLLFKKAINMIVGTYTFKVNKLVNGLEYLGKNVF